MLRTLIRDALASEAPVADLTVCGWIRTRRDAKDVIFLEINDGSCLTNLQCVVDPDSPVREKLGGDGTGASLCVKGDLVASPGKGQRWELHAKTLRILGHADPETYPLQKKRHSDEFLRSIAHLRVRTNKYSPSSACAPARLPLSTPFSAGTASSGCTLPFSRVQTARVRARCSA